MITASKYLRLERLPHIWCPGCGNGIVLQALVQALEDLKLERDDVVAVAGIGCSSRSAGYLDLNTVHSAHGRAIPFATGIKLANPKLRVVVITGDGDCTAIGGNHLIHAARRNLDITVILFNNSTYGMTSGQSSPLMPKGAFGTTATYGNIEQPFNICDLAIAGGATYVARGTTFHAKQLHRLIAAGIEHKGFSFVEAVTGCPTYYGKLNKAATGPLMLQAQRDHAIAAKDATLMTPEQLKDKYIIGELHRSQRQECSDAYHRLFEHVYGA